MNREEANSVQDFIQFHGSLFARKHLQKCLAPEVWQQIGNELGNQIWEQVHRNVASYVQSEISKELGIWEGESLFP